MSSDCGSVVSAGAEQDFVARIASGDRDAEAEFLRRYSNGVRVLLRRRCRSGDPAVEDLAQEVLSNVLERLRAGAIRDPEALPAYVQTAVAYAANGEYRRRKPVEELAAATELAAKDNPSDSLYRDQLGALLERLLDQLPVARDRLLLRHFYLEEHPKNQVCAELGIEPAHFHRVVFRARQRFRELLELHGIGASP